MTQNEHDQGHAAHTQAAEHGGGLAGAFNRPVKITILGAGSHFTHPLVNDILAIDGLTGGEIALVDINAARLKPMAEIAQRLIDARGLDDWTITATTDRLEALPNTDYLINSIDVGGVDCVRPDNDIPLKYGVDQCIGDTIGPGGLFKALRTGPVWLDILQDASVFCPNALVMNYTNPMSILCLAAARDSAMDVVGLCHSVQLTSRKLARHAGVPYDELRWECAGINHLAWFTKLERGGQDLYPTLLETVRDRTGDVYESDPVRYDMMMHFGAFITESSGHLSEYLPYYRRNKDLIAEYCRDGYRGESSFYANNWPRWRREQDAQRDKVLRGEAELVRERSFEYASWIIEAIEKHSPFVMHGNVHNAPGSIDNDAGRLITNLPAGCVEVACLVDGNGVQPTRHGALPAQMAGVCAGNMAMFDLAATAILDRSKEAAIHALLLDPLTAACCTPAQIKAMTLEMFDVEKRWLSEYA